MAPKPRPPIHGRSERPERCVYCGGIAESRDHSPPKCLLSWPPATNVKILTLASCLRCNQATSRAENLVSVILALVGRHPLLEQYRTPGGKVDRALANDPSLKEVIANSKTLDGNYELTGVLKEAFDRVIRKTAQGLYFGLYGTVPAINLFELLAIEHTDSSRVDDLVSRFRHDGMRELVDEPLPSVTQTGLRNVFVVEALMTNAETGQTESLHQSVMQIPVQSNVEWTVYQESTIRFAFFEGEGGDAVCVVELWGTLVCAVRAPWPSQRGALRKGRKNPYAR